MSKKRKYRQVITGAKLIITSHSIAIIERNPNPKPAKDENRWFARVIRVNNHRGATYFGEMTERSAINYAGYLMRRDARETDGRNSTKHLIEKLLKAL